MLSVRELLIDGPIYSIFSKDNKIIHLGKLKKKENHPKGYALRFENWLDSIIINNLEKKLFFINPPDWCDECYEDFIDDCCCSIFHIWSEEDSINNIHMWGIIYSEK